MVKGLLLLLEAHALYYSEKLQRGQFSSQRRNIPGALFKAYVIRHLTAYCTKLTAQIGIILILQKLLPYPRFYVGGIDALVYSFKILKFSYKRKSRLLPHPRNAGNVVGGVSHKRLDLYKLFRLDSVILPYFLRIVYTKLGLSRLCGGKKDGGIVIHKLKTVPVACGDKAFVSLF